MIIMNLLSWYQRAVASELHTFYSSDPSSFDKLDFWECFNSYNKQIISSHSHLLIVISATTDFGSITVTNANGDKLWPNWTDIGLNEADAATIPSYW